MNSILRITDPILSDNSIDRYRKREARSTRVLSKVGGKK